MGAITTVTTVARTPTTTTMTTMTTTTSPRAAVSAIDRPRVVPEFIEYPLAFADIGPRISRSLIAWGRFCRRHTPIRLPHGLVCRRWLIPGIGNLAKHPVQKVEDIIGALGGS